MMVDRDVLLSLAGPVLTGYLTDPTMIEIMLNDNGTCYLNRFGVGKIEAEHPGFDVLDRYLRGIAHEVGAEWSPASPELSAALDEVGWRIEAGRAPVAAAPYMSLRLHPQHIFTLDDYESQGILTHRERTILEQAMQEGKRLIIGGAVGSAKTSLGNALLHCIRHRDLRALIIEDDPELICEIRNCVRRHVVKGVNTLRSLVQRSLRLNPDLLVIGELRGAEALDAMKAFQTGHGGLTTIHVDAIAHTLGRVEQLVQETSVSPQQALIGEVIDLVVHMAKRALSWRCTGILAVNGYANNAYLTEPLA